jgi:hypothetical protein
LKQEKSGVEPAFLASNLKLPTSNFFTPVPSLRKIIVVMPVGAGLLNAAEQSHEYED